MKLAIEKSILEGALAALQPFLEKRDSTLITTHVLFESRDGTLSLKATDLEFGLSVSVNEFKADKDISFTANGKKILDVTRALNDGEVIIESEGDSIHIKQKRLKYKLPSLDSTMFPQFCAEGEEGEKITIDHQKLISGIKKISPAIASNNQKVELTGALIDIKSGTINLVSTDTKRLAIFKIDHSSNENLSIIIPKKAIAEIQKIFSNDLQLFYDGTNFTIKSENYFFFTKVINGKYPDYERIIPRDLKLNLEFQVQTFLDAIKQTSILMPEIKITFDNKEVGFETLDDGNETAKSGIEADIEIDKPITLAANSKFIIEFLTQCQSETFMFSINDSNVPFVLKNEQLSTIIMPIMI